MVAWATQSERNARGVRRFDAARDIGPVTDVIGVAFAHELGPSERAVLREYRMLQLLAPLLRLAQRVSPEFDALFGGYVWVEGGKIVGTVTLQRLGASNAHWLISNVGVLPEYRRQGIAHQLMEAAIDAAWAQGGRIVTLQVRENNYGAYKMYTDLGFRLMEKTATLDRPPGLPPKPAPTTVPLRAWGARDIDQVLALAQAVTPQTYQDLLPLRRVDFIPEDPAGLESRLAAWLRGSRLYRLAVPDGDRFAATLQMRARLRGGFHHLELAVHPDWRGQLEPALINYALRTLLGHAPRSVIAEVRATDTDAITALHDAGFRTSYVLDRLGLPLGPPG